MATDAQAKAYRKSQADVVRLAHRDLAAFWKLLDTSNPVAAKATLQEFMVTLVGTYGEVSGALAADYYDTLRTEAKVRGAHRSALAAPIDAEKVTQSASWASQPLFDDVADASAALSRAQGVSQRLVQETGRNTLFDNGRRDPAKPRWARVPIGDSCDFCIMLASRGAVYLSSDSAGAMTGFHDHDDCQPTPSFNDGDLPYDVDAAMGKYLAQTAKSSDGKPAQPGGFDSLTREQIQNHIAQTEPLKDSEWRTAQLKRLRARLAELK